MSTPAHTIAQLAEDRVDTCDAMLLAGTSGVVFTAAQLPINAHHLGRFVAEINPTPSSQALGASAQARPMTPKALLRTQRQRPFKRRRPRL